VTDRSEDNMVCLKKVACPRCGSEESNVLFSGKDFLYSVPGTYFVSECTSCRLWFQNPRPLCDQLARLYPDFYGPHMTMGQAVGESTTQKPIGRPRALFKAKCNSLYSKLLAGPLGDWLSGVELNPVLVPGGTLLEIGCASGARLNSLRSKGWQHLYGIEAVPNAAEKARSLGLQVETGAAEAVLPLYQDSFFDVITTSMVLEHLFDPFEVVHQVSRKLKPSGQFLFSTVVRDSLDARLFGHYWSGFDFPRHMVHFRKRDVYQMISEDFENIKCFHQNAPIDFVRPAKWRGNPIDKLISRVASSSAAELLCLFLVWTGQTCRVSFSCRKKL